MKKSVLRIIFTFLLGAFSLYGYAQTRVVGYQPYWSGSASSIQYSKLTHINYSFALPQSNGRLKPLNNPSFLQQIVSNAHAVGTKVFIAIGGWSDNGVVLDPTFETLAANATSRTNLVNDAMYLVDTYKLDGVDMDWEYPDPGSSSQNFALLMQQLSTELRKRGKQLSAAVTASYGGGGIPDGAWNYIDFINVMAYDNTSEPNHSTINFAQSSLNYWIGTRKWPKNQVVLGVPFYARPSWTAYKDLLARGANPNSDQFGSDYYNGIPTIQKKTEMAYQQCGGIMIWELSQDATGTNSLLTAIDSKLKSLRGTVNQAPTVSITSPANGASFTAPASITISANAADADGSIARVEFYNGSTLIASDNTSPYSISWSNVAAGSYTLTARAFDNAGASTTSAAVSITVRTATTNQPPTVSITSPSNGASFTAPASITISANAADADGSIARVEFYHGSTLIASDNTSPYSISWSSVAAGSYTLTARAFDNAGASTTSAAVSITVTSSNNNTGSCTAPAWNAITAYNGGATVSYNSRTYRAKWWTQGEQPDQNTGSGKPWEDLGPCNGSTNQAPTVSITSPTNGASFTAPASITISANAADADGSILRVEFYNGSTLIASDNSSPYSISWTNVAAGTYSITARAFDNAGASTTSAAVSITVSSSNNNNTNCSAAAWSATQVYVGGNMASYNGRNYRAKWWTQGERPDLNTGVGLPWEDLGPCAGARKATVVMANEGVSPNPSSGTSPVNITYYSDITGSETVSIISTTGNPVKAETINVIEGENNISIDFSDIQQGMYLMKIGEKTFRFVRQ